MRYVEFGSFRNVIFQPLLFEFVTINDLNIICNVTSFLADVCNAGPSLMCLILLQNKNATFKLQRLNSVTI